MATLPSGLPCYWNFLPLAKAVKSRHISPFSRKEIYRKTPRQPLMSMNKGSLAPARVWAGEMAQEGFVFKVLPLLKCKNIPEKQI